MLRFVYKAKSHEGLMREGKIEARDMTTAVGILRERGLVVVSIHPLNELVGLASLLKAFQKVKFEDTVAFTRQLATMIASGLSLTETLSVLEVQSNPGMGRVVGEILRDVQGGASMAEALEKHDTVFSKVYISLVKAGEAAGAMDEVLKRLADNMEKQQDFRNKTKGAMVYPVIVLTAMLGVATVMMIFVIPKMSAMYEDFGAELPLTTKLLIAMSNFTSNYWYIVILMVIAFVIGFNYWKNTPHGRSQYDTMMLKAPVFGKLKAQLMLAEMTRTISLLSSAGITLIETLEIVGEGMNNWVYHEAIMSSIRNIKKGVPFSVSIARQGLFPPLLANMTAVGEETGKLDEVMMKVSGYFEMEAETSIKNLTTAMEPLIMIVLGVGVGFLVLSIVMPIYNLTSKF
jgi:type IV pilus assembly protein PilC